MTGNRLKQLNLSGPIQEFLARSILKRNDAFTMAFLRTALFCSIWLGIGIFWRALLRDK